MASTDGMDPGFGAALQAMIAASHGALYIESGYRDEKTQVGLWKQALAKYGSESAARQWVAKPVSLGGDGSNHTKGIAADLGGDLALAHQLAPQFGLVFPMSWENWHIEPVHARDASAKGAYTDPPPGAQNPVTDPSWSSQPDVLAASVIDSLKAGSVKGDIQNVASLSGDAGSAAASLTGDVSGTDSAGTGGSAGGGGGGGGPAIGASPNQQAYIQEVLPYAEAESRRTGIPVEVMIVQSGLETGWGTSQWWRDHRNPAGIGVTGQAGAGNTYPDIGAAFHDYADKLMGHGEAGQNTFAEHVAAGADPLTLLHDLQQSPWAAGHYGGNGLVDTYQSLYGAGRQAAPAPPLATSASASPPATDPRRLAR